MDKNKKIQILEVALVLILGLAIFQYIALKPIEIKGPKYYILGIGAVSIMALLWPKVLAPVSWVWFKIGHILGKVTNKILLGTIYFLLLTPLSFLRRLFSSKPKKVEGSYWIAVNKSISKEDLIKQF